jgi:hypothetical protein
VRTSATLCTGCGAVSYPADEDCDCGPELFRLPIVPTKAAELSTARWQCESLERIADALEELVTFKENEVRERNRMGN